MPPKTNKTTTDPVPTLAVAHTKPIKTVTKKTTNTAAPKITPSMADNVLVIEEKLVKKSKPSFIGKKSPVNTMTDEVLIAEEKKPVNEPTIIKKKIGKKATKTENMDETSKPIPTVQSTALSLATPAKSTKRKVPTAAEATFEPIMQVSAVKPTKTKITNSIKTPKTVDISPDTVKTQSDDLSTAINHPEPEPSPIEEVKPTKKQKIEKVNKSEEVKLSKTHFPTANITIQKEKALFFGFHGEYLIQLIADLTKTSIINVGFTTSSTTDPCDTVLHIRSRLNNPISLDIEQEGIPGVKKNKAKMKDIELVEEVGIEEQSARILHASNLINTILYYTTPGLSVEDMASHMSTMGKEAPKEGLKISTFTKSLEIYHTVTPPPKNSKNKKAKSPTSTIKAEIITLTNPLLIQLNKYLPYFILTQNDTYIAVNIDKNDESASNLTIITSPSRLTAVIEQIHNFFKEHQRGSDRAMNDVTTLALFFPEFTPPQYNQTYRIPKVLWEHIHYTQSTLVLNENLSISSHRGDHFLITIYSKTSFQDLQAILKTTSIKKQYDILYNKYITNPGQFLNQKIKQMTIFEMKAMLPDGLKEIAIKTLKKKEERMRKYKRRLHAEQLAKERAEQRAQREQLRRREQSENAKNKPVNEKAIQKKVKKVKKVEEKTEKKKTKKPISPLEA